MSPPAYRFATMRLARPWPVSALARRLGIRDGDPTSTSQLVQRLGLDRRNVMRYRHWGLTTRQAEDWAARAGLHPGEVWPTYWLLDHLHGQALINAARETCPQGHPYDHFDRFGWRRCSTCHRAAVRRHKQAMKTQLTALITLPEAS